MKALRSFAVRASLPDSLGILAHIALNLRWAWDARTVDLFRWIDPEVWDASGHDPVRMLGLVSRERFDELAEDGPFLSFLASIEEELQRYLDEPRWFQGKQPTSPLRTVAYFSPEFGVSEALPIYSGGLGVLAGDHLKAASDLGVPLVGVGLLYRQGYFRQHLNNDGWQQENYPALDPHGMPLTLLTGDDGGPIKVSVDLAGSQCVAQLWRAQVGRVPLVLLDCDVEENDPRERAVTDRLYAGASEHRLRQEIVLGIGGVRAMEAAGYDPDVFHSNEGHAGFLGLERARRLVVDEGMSLSEAIQACRVSTVFTTHTPVPAGIDVYSAELMKQYFENFAKECEVSFEELMALGQVVPMEWEPGEVGPSFNMAIMGFRLAARSNGVSKLHGVVSRNIFADLWADVPEDEVPIGSVTNGVHISTWVGPEMVEVLDRRLAPGWTETGDARWDRIMDVPDAELWRARERARERLVYFVRERVKAQHIARGEPESDLSWADEIFDPGILTIGFARRFAQYKRATLMLTDVERLAALLLHSERPIQIVVAGKAHPLDEIGKEMIRQIVHFSEDPAVRARIAFIEDYDMEVARVLCQGSDVWLNNPRRPLEACGTSGMKAALNGVLNCSVSDGWWDECYDGTNGWVIGSRETYEDPGQQDRVDSNALYNLLEREIGPRFYDRSEGPVPRRWVERMKRSLATLGPFVMATRMMEDYVTDLYEPSAEQGHRMTADGYSLARELAAWKARVREVWADVAIVNVEGELTAAEVAEEREVAATVRLGRLSTDDVSVQLAHGPVGGNNEIADPTIIEMRADVCRDGVCTYRGRFSTDEAGLYGYAVRVVPFHKELVNPMDQGLLTWA